MLKVSQIVRTHYASSLPWIREARNAAAKQLGKSLELEPHEEEREVNRTAWTQGV